MCITSMQSRKDEAVSKVDLNSCSWHSHSTLMYFKAKYWPEWSVYCSTTDYMWCCHYDIYQKKYWTETGSIWHTTWCDKCKRHGSKIGLCQQSCWLVHGFCLPVGMWGERSEPWVASSSTVALKGVNKCIFRDWTHNIVI